MTPLDAFHAATAELRVPPIINVDAPPILTAKPAVLESCWRRLQWDR